MFAEELRIIFFIFVKFICYSKPRGFSRIKTWKFPSRTSTRLSHTGVGSSSSSGFFVGNDNTGQQNVAKCVDSVGGMSAIAVSDHNGRLSNQNGGDAAGYRSKFHADSASESGCEEPGAMGAQPLPTAEFRRPAAVAPSFVPSARPRKNSMVGLMRKQFEETARAAAAPLAVKRGSQRDRSGSESSGKNVARLRSGF